MIVRALGKDALGNSGSFPWLKALPRFARITLPACHRDEALILPNLGNAEFEGHSFGFHANFVGGRGVHALPPVR